MEAWLSWALSIALFGAAYWYYSQNSHRNRNRGRSVQRTSATTTARGEPVQWSDTEAISKKAKKAVKEPRKSVKKAVQEVGDKAEAYLSAASTAGADADDDLSPAVSPSLGATSFKAPSGKDVSDMLEPKGSVASVLRINSSEKPARQNKPQQQRPETPQETKKQRQNRKKAEEAKAQREADEKERRVLLEKQRRTAREARGEPARNGLQPAQAPASNAWAGGRLSSGAGAVQPQNGQLLDTFDPDVVSTASSSEAATNGTAPTPDSMGNSAQWTNLPSEEEQLRMAMEDSAWETVPKGKKQKKNRAAGETTEEGSETGAPPEPTPVPAPVKKVQPTQPENNKPQSRYEVLSVPTTDATHPMDSDWPVV
ncbi:hypothetical protein K491DRAFT_703988 [Lophiostoma macrostomum CBS 122681]|uniref:Uncharacterized protein n=1 Tax=Lophiostoma macrostomum CBS 122681 TaxID=1314788 RepID=A0A6A6T9C4_9PLEO|nr:hypothetical protein K491DRAFT_703988 [Lophiostoma macrostomum CBS 122681]